MHIKSVSINILYSLLIICKLKSFVFPYLILIFASKYKSNKIIIMRKIFLLILGCVISASCFADPTDIPLNCDGEPEIFQGPHKAPVSIPHIGIEGYTLTFYTPCDGCTLRLSDENDNVVYTTVIPVGATSLVLPSYLSGDYRIEIIQGAIYFWGIIEL